MQTDVAEQLKMLKPYIPQPMYRTIRGQIKAGDIDGALTRIKRQIQKLAKGEK